MSDQHHHILVYFSDAFSESANPAGFNDLVMLL